MAQDTVGTAPGQAIDLLPGGSKDILPLTATDTMPMAAQSEASNVAGTGVAGCRTDLQPQVLETAYLLRRVCGLCICHEVEQYDVSRLQPGLP